MELPPFPLGLAGLTLITMWQLYQFALCPFSRKVRLLMGEKGIGYELVREYPWERRDEFLECIRANQRVNPDRGLTLIHSSVICEFLEETVDKTPMISGTAPNRAEIRRLTSWFDEQFYMQVVGPLLHERMEKRLIHRTSPDGGVLREAMRNANQLLDYIDWLLDHRNWLAGSSLSLADLAAAAHISVADYLGGIDWRGHEQTKRWYSGLKSRPSFRPLLSEKMEIIPPPTHYDKVDF